MSWYRSGTIAVTNGSVTVTGTGTAFVGAVQPGWGLAAPDGRLYEIAAVVSATGLTLATPYLGSTGSGQSYAAFPTRGEIAPFVSQLQSLLGTVQATVDGAGAGKFADGTAATPGLRFAADEDTGVLRPAANQIGFATGGVQRALLSTAALNLSVPVTGTAVTQSKADTTAGRLLKVADFGLGETGTATAIPADGANPGSGFYRTSTAADNAYGTEGAVIRGVYSAARQIEIMGRITGGLIRFQGRTQITDNTWGSIVEFYHSRNLLGTVSQSAGIPTGAMIERGSNANGEYVRLADGTQIVWKTLTGLGPITTAQGGVFVSANISLGALAATFIAAPVRLLSSGRSSSNVATWISGGSSPGTGSGGDCVLARGDSNAATDYILHAQFTGRWF